MADVFKNLGFVEDSAPQAAPKSDPFAGLGFVEDKPAEEAPSSLEAGLRGLGQGASLGFLDEGAGALGALGDKLSGNDISLLDLYTKHRDEERKRNDAAKAAHPYLYGGGNIAGSIGSLAVGGGALGLGKLGLVARGALEAGAMGLGESNADLTKGEVRQSAKDTLGSAVLGGAISKVVPAVGSALSPTKQYLSDKLGTSAENFAIKHLRPTAAVSRELGPDGVRSAAREALDAGAISPFSKAQDTAATLNNLTDEVGAAKGDIVNASDAQIDPRDVTARIKNEVIDPLRQTAEGQPIADSIQGKSDGLLEQYAPDTTPNPQISPSQLEAEKMAVQRNINYRANSNAANDATQDYARILKEEAEKAVNDPGFQRSKEAYQNLIRAQGMAERTGALNDSGNGLLGHITDMGLSSGALMHPDPVTIGAAVGRGITKGRVTSTAAWGLNNISNLLAKNPQAYGKFSGPLLMAAKRGSSALAATHFILQQSEPAYRAINDAYQKDFNGAE